MAKKLRPIGTEFWVDFGFVGEDSEATKIKYVVIDYAEIRGGETVEVIRPIEIIKYIPET